MIHLTPIASPQDVQHVWQQLSLGGKHSFFLSWYWIGTWLRCLPASVQPQLLSVTSDGAPVAAAVLVKTVLTRRRVIPVRTWTLNATGMSEFDCIATEYNGLLSRPEHGLEAWREVLQHFRGEPDWDEIGLDGVPPELVNEWVQENLPIREERSDVSRYVDLAQIRAHRSGSHLGLVSSNARNKIRRTRAGLEKRYGPLSIYTARSVSDARELLGELKAFHIVRWAKIRGGSPFVRPFAERFHRDLIDQYFDSGVIQLARIDAGNTTIGVIYSFIHQGRVSFYQGGINYAAAAPGESPGLLCHSLLIDHNAQLGHSHYDMLAGDSRYKRTLAQGSSELWWGALQTPRLKFKAENLARLAYRAIRPVPRK